METQYLSELGKRLKTAGKAQKNTQDEAFFPEVIRLEGVRLLKYAEETRGFSCKKD